MVDAKSADSAVTVDIPEAAQEGIQVGIEGSGQEALGGSQRSFSEGDHCVSEIRRGINSLGQVEIQLKDGKGAVKAFRSATQIDPSLQRSQYVFGCVLL